MIAAILLAAATRASTNVAVCVCAKPVGPFTETALATLLTPSLERTVSPFELHKYNVSLYVGIDSTDHEYARWVRTQLKTPSWLSLAVAMFEPTGRIPFNEITHAAWTDGADYIVRVNDDTEFITSRWLTSAVRALTRYDPPNVGVVGPVCNEGNTAIMTHDMVHRTHLGLFNGTYYPAVLNNWYIDDWITRVYEPGRSTKLTLWRVKHHTSKHGTRYTIDTSQERTLYKLVDAGRIRVSEWTRKARGGGTTVVSYSLYGSNPRYTDGAVANAQLMPEVYPGWQMRVYYDSTVPEHILTKLGAYSYANLVRGDPTLSPMLWRFLVASDYTVNRYVVRDIDSRLSGREKAAVNEWINSSNAFHVMRDHPSHSNYAMSGGMWGGTKEAFPHMKDLLGGIGSEYIADMNFLTKMVWPIAKQSIMQHDAFGCHSSKWGKTQPFPSIRLGAEHVGSVYVGGNMRQGDVDILKNAMDTECKPAALHAACSSHGHIFFGMCFCDAGFRGPNCTDHSRTVLPCIDGNGQNPDDLTPESGTDRCFHSRLNGRMAPPDGAERWKKAQHFESALWASSGGDDDRIETHQQGFNMFATLGPTPNFGHLMEVGSGPFTQTKGVLENIHGANVETLTFFDPSMDLYMTKVKHCSYKTGKLKRYKQAGFWPYPVTTLNVMPTAQYDTVIAFNVITHVQNGYQWLTDLYNTVRPGGMLLFSDYYFDGTDENFWYVPDAYYHPVRPFRRVYNHFFNQFDILYEHIDVLTGRPIGLHDTVGYWILRRKQTSALPPVDASTPKQTCFPHATGDIPHINGPLGQVSPVYAPTFARTLTALAARSDVYRIFEIGTWYGGGSTQAFVDGLKPKANCVSNGTHHCCDAFVTTFEIYEPAWNHARLYHQNNPVWLVMGTTVGGDKMLRADEIPTAEKGEHYQLYYERDKKIMQNNAPQLETYCRQLSPDVVLIDGNEYTGWGEFQVVMEACRPKYLALHDTGTLKTAKVEAYIQTHPAQFKLLKKGVDGAGWAVFIRNTAFVPLFSESDLLSTLKARNVNVATMQKTDAARQRMFEDVYSHSTWTHGDPTIPKSGSGSTLTKTKGTRRALQEAVVRYNITSIVDAPCGDLTWMRAMFPFFKKRNVQYTGVDIATAEITQLRKEFPEHRFKRLDMVSAILPKADLIFSRQALQHMNAEDNLRVINNWHRSGARYVLQTTYRSDVNSNYQLVSGGSNSLINLETGPYNFPPPIETWSEQDRPEFTEVLALWAFPATTRRPGRKLLSTSALTPSSAAAPTAFKIIILTQRRYKSLQRLLDSIAASVYDSGPPVHLEIRVDFHDSKYNQKTVKVAQSFAFFRGSKKVYIHNTTQGLQRAWFNAWTPTSETERAVILEDDMELSPLWFQWLQRAWKTYGDRNDLGGISLCRQRLRASDGASIIKQHDAPFLYKMVGSFGFSPNARHWKPFAKWAQGITNLALENVDVPGTISTTWHRSNPDSWEQFWIWWCWHNQSLYTLYVHPPNGALIAHWAEPGVHAGAKGHPNDRLVSIPEPVLTTFPLTLTRFGWNFEVTTRPRMAAQAARQVVSAPELWENPEYDITSKVYTRLKQKLQHLKQTNKPLLIKINSHPCAGKTTFIKEKAGQYLGVTLLDFDDYQGVNRTSLLLQSYQSNAALFGTGDNAHRWHTSTHDDHERVDNIVYMYVTPRLAQVHAQIIRRQIQVRSKRSWANTTRILAARNNLLHNVFNGGVQVAPMFYSFRECIDFCVNAYNSSFPDSPTPIIWSNDFHISPIANMKRLLPEAQFIDKSLSGACSQTKTCATDLKVLNRNNGISPSPATRRAFVDAYKDNPEFAKVDIVMCFHPSAMCELFMSLKKRLFVIATTRYEMGRHSKQQWLDWNANLKRIAADPGNVVAANNLYDAKYIEYFTGLRPLVLPSFAPALDAYTPQSDTVLIAEMHSTNANKVMKSITSVSHRLVPLREKYPKYTYRELCSNTAILHIPYQLSVMSLFEQYGMGIPIIVPSIEFLWKLHDKYDIATERTWDRVRFGKRPSGSPIAGVTNLTPDPNNDFDEQAFKHWVAFGDVYQWPHIVTFDSFGDLRSVLRNTDWGQKSQGMRSYWHKTMKSTNETLHGLLIA